jgi:3-hydroxyacyl-CoA dehydrogenase
LPPLLAKLDRSKRHGIKTGKGFFDHSVSPPVITDDLAPAARNENEDAIEMAKTRLIYAFIAESLRCLEEGVALADALDTAMMMGAGLPKGPIAKADELGLENVLDQLGRLSTTFGNRFWPSPILRIHVLAGFTGVSSGRGLAGPY